MTATYQVSRSANGNYIQMERIDKNAPAVGFFGVGDEASTPPHSDWMNFRVSQVEPGMFFEYRKEDPAAGLLYYRVSLDDLPVKRTVKFEIEDTTQLTSRSPGWPDKSRAEIESEVSLHEQQLVNQALARAANAREQASEADGINAFADRTREEVITQRAEMTGSIEERIRQAMRTGGYTDEEINSSAF